MERCLTEVPPLEPVERDSHHLSACWLPRGASERAAVLPRATGGAIAP